MFRFPLNAHHGDASSEYPKSMSYLEVYAECTGTTFLAEKETVKILRNWWEEMFTNTQLQL